MTACPLCGSLKHRQEYDLSNLHREQDVAGLIVRCLDCAMQYKIITNKTQFENAYAKESADTVIEHYGQSDTTRVLFQKALRAIQPQTSSKPPRLLDIGAGQGTLVEEAARIGYQAEGLELNPANVKIAEQKGLKVRQGSAESLNQTEAFDAITMMDLIEHVTQPLELLRAAYHALKPGGELLVYTPNHRAAVVLLADTLHKVGMKYPIQEIFGSNHVCFFDDRSLALALNKTGFKLRLENMEPYDPARPGQYVSPLNLAAITFAEWLGKPLGRVFRMYFYAQKPK